MLFFPGQRATMREEEIIGAAVKLFTQKGYINTSMDDIAEAVGLTKGGLYHHVGRKEDLLTAIHDQILDTFFSRVEAAVRTETQPARKLDEWIRAHVTVMRDFQPQIKIFFTEVDNLSEENFRRMIRKRDAAQRMLRDILAEGMDTGAFRSDVNPNIVSFMILGMINWLYMWYRPHGSLTMEEIIRNMHEVIFSGLVSRKNRFDEGRNAGGRMGESTLSERAY